jgi:hypothetical protein
MGFAAILLLWLTGLPMAWLAAGTLALGWVFYAKLLGATLALGAALYGRHLRQAASAAGRPPAIARMQMISRLSSLGVATAIVFAVLAFN